MHIVWLILKIIGFTLLGLLGLIVLLLFVPVGADVNYADKTLGVDVRVLFLRFRVLPAKQKKSKKQKETPEQKKEAEPEKEKKKFTLDTLKQITDLVAPAGKAAGYVLKKIKIKRVRVYIDVARAELADTGILAGELWAGIGFLFETLKNIFTVKVDEFFIKPDFDSEESHFDASASAAVRTLPIFAVIAAFIFLINWLRNKRNTEEQSDGGTTRDDRDGRDSGGKNQRDTGRRDDDRQAG